MGRPAASRGRVSTQALIACAGFITLSALAARVAGISHARTGAATPGAATPAPRGSASPSPFTTVLALASPTSPAATGVKRTATPRARPTATATPRVRPTPTLTPTPNPHPGFGAVPWSPGEYYEWQIAGPNVRGTAWQLITHSGHEWVDSSALVERSYGVSSTFTSRLSFDANNYRLRRYDGVQDVPAGVLRATLSGQHLTSTLYKSWGRKGCTVGARDVPPDTMVYGLMADVIRTSALRDGRSGSYVLFDPFGSRPLVRATYAISSSQTLSTTDGPVTTIPVLFREGTQPPLVVWYAAAAPHAVLQWATPGVLTATLSHYEARSTRTSLPVAVPVVPLKGTDAACR